MLQHTLLLAVNRMIFKNRKIRDPRESLFTKAVVFRKITLGAIHYLKVLIKA